MKYRTWTEQNLIDAVKTSDSITKVLIKLKLSVAGGSHTLIKNYIKNMNLDTSHFKGQAWNKNNYKKNLIEILTTDSEHYDSCSLKNRLLKENLLRNKCTKCGLSDIWNNKPINLHLDHINGIKNDNRIENLRILCPNCHSQTPTYAGRNIKKLKVN